MKASCFRIIISAIVCTPVLRSLSHRFNPLCSFFKFRKRHIIEVLRIKISIFFWYLMNIQRLPFAPSMKYFVSCVSMFLRGLIIWSMMRQASLNIEMRNTYAKHCQKSHFDTCRFNSYFINLVSFKSYFYRFILFLFLGKICADFDFLAEHRMVSNFCFHLANLRCVHLIFSFMHLRHLSSRFVSPCAWHFACLQILFMFSKRLGSL